VHCNPVSSLESATIFLSRQKSSDFRGKIMWGKDLALRYSVFKERFVTACAGAIMREFEIGRKVRCHKWGCGKRCGSVR
jgi:hypothetical protein